MDGKLRKVGTYKELSDDDEFMELVGSQVQSIWKKPLLVN